jgi:penicillin-binding protein 1A
MDRLLPIAERGRAERGPVARPAMTAALAVCVRSLAVAAWLLMTQPGRRLRLRAALRRLGATVAEHGGALDHSGALDRLLADHAAAARQLQAAAPPWPGPGVGLAERARGLGRGALLRWGDPRQLARLRLRAAERRLGAASMDLPELPGRVMAVRQHAGVVSEALVGARAEAEDLVADTRDAWAALLATAGTHLRLAAGRTARTLGVGGRHASHATRMGSLAAGRATRAGSLAAGRAARSGSLVAGRATRAGSLAAGRATRSASSAAGRASRSASVAAGRATRAGSLTAGRATLAGSLVAGRAARSATLATGRATRTGSLAAGRGVWTSLRATGRGIRWVVLAFHAAMLAVATTTIRLGRAAGRPLEPVVKRVAAPPDPALPRWRRFLRPLAAALTLTLLAGALAGLPAAVMLAGSVKAASAGLPDLATMKPLSQPERTQVYDRNGRLIEVLHDEQDRIVVPLASMPQVLRDAVLAAEDERFYQHGGIDDRGILRALLANLIQGQTVQGGSTITQQLVRNAYPDLHDRSLVRKVKEASLAAQLEERMTKDQILEAYLNRVYFGAGYYGVEAASRGYFGRHVANLSLAQAATLAGIIREPERANPRSNPDQARQRRDTVLRQMASLKMVDAASAARASRDPVRVQPPRETGGRYPWFIDALKTQLMNDPRLGSTPAERHRTLYEGGLRIDTTLDPTTQQQAEQAAAAGRPESGPDVALVSIDPRDGAVRAMVGGRNYSRRKFNLATQAERQAGSSFKPFVLATAMDNGISPDSRWESSGFSSDEVCGRPWTVGNFEGKGSGRISLREATWRSVNGVYARVMGRLCPPKVVSMARRLGVTVPESQAHAPSIALGAANVTPLEMASAYATIADLGVYHRPMLFTSISRHGETLIENRAEGDRRISAALAYQVTDVLKGVVRSGTGTAAQIGRPEAGKTGTSQDYRDAWFIGYTPQLATAVWMGNPEQEEPMLDVGGIRVTGGSYPARIWHDFMAAALAGQPAVDWSRPDGSLGFSVLPPKEPSSQPDRQRWRPPGRGNGNGRGRGRG